MAKVVVVAPHPDDEVLGVGGTIARLAEEEHEVFVAVATRGDSTMFEEQFIEEGRQEALLAHAQLGVYETVFLEGLPAALLDTIPQSRINGEFGKLFERVNPELLFIPFNGDLHRDHRLVFEAALVAARPVRDGGIRAIYAYETLSETNWHAAPLTPGFCPNTFVDISKVLDVKLTAMKIYRTQLKEFPHERSLEGIAALARLRGVTAGFEAAEAFTLIRSRFSLGNAIPV